MNELFTRKVILEDRKVIWEWWNDPITRKMMKLNEYVPWDDHVKWFEDTIYSDRRVLFISMKDNQKLGVVRFDLKDNETYEVSINLNPEYRGKGNASKILKSSINEFLKTDVKVKKLFAIFKKINIASKNTFLNNSFKLIDNPNPNQKGLERFNTETEEYCEYINNKNGDMNVKVTN